MNTGPEVQTTMVMEGSPETPSSNGSTIVGGDISAKSYANVLECFICMEPPTDPVVASCGHVFCWPCMYRWLQNQSKPCPVCRYILRRDLNIIPLHGAGDQACARSSIANNSPSDSTIIPDADNPIPPRPRNPLLVEDTATPEDPIQFVLTSNSLFVAYERSVSELSDALAEERIQVRHMVTERANLELEVHDWDQRNSTLRRQVQDTDRQIFVLRNQRVLLEGDLKEKNARLQQEVEERRDRDQWLVERENEMEAQIGRLQQCLARTHSLLDSGV